MDSFVSSLRNQLAEAVGQKSLWGDVNPLVVIGLTEAILDLGLTEDQIYSVIRSYGRQLAAQAHPDKQAPNFSPERQREILEAFDFLDNRENFSKALIDFRTLRAEDRRETRILGQTVTALRNQITTFESQSNAVAEQKRQFAEEIAKYERLKAEEPLIIPGLERSNKEMRSRISILNTHITNAEQNSARWKRKFGYTANYISSVGNIVSKDPNSAFVFDARWVAVVSLWHHQYSIPSPMLSDKKIDPNFFEIAKSIGIGKKETKIILARFNWAYKSFGTADRLESKILPLSLSIIGLESGKPKLLFGNPTATHGGRIIGSISRDKINISRTDLTRTVNQDVVFETLSPHLTIGGLLVSVQQQESRKASWSLIHPSFKFNTKRIILGFG